jgi:protein-S-isoprenylcysteine O-methyltransferase Ste14
VGYLCTLRLFNCHIRSTEPTLKGWVVCIACYPPFWGLLYERYVTYDDQYYWGDYFTIGAYGDLVWGSMIIALVIVYVWATVSFGARFSNLTNRGIITSGPYRFTKHPAYISKNISWWLISVPFIAHSDVLDSLKMCVLLLMVNGIYYLRAKTEEAHLSLDPAYVEYEQWMARHGPLARIGRAASKLVRDRD